MMQLIVRALTWTLGGLAAFLALVSVAFWVLRVRHRRALDKARRRLENTAPPRVSTGDTTRSLPEPVRRYFAHAIRAGAPHATVLHSGLVLRVQRPKHDPSAPWHEYHYRQVMTPAGMVMEGRRVAERIPNRVSFWYWNGRGWAWDAWLDLIPAMLETDESFARILRIRHLFQLVWLPAALLPRPGVQWKTGTLGDPEVTLSLDGERVTIRFVLDEEGRPRELFGSMWARIGTEERQMIPVRVRLEDEETFGDHTIPTAMTIGWWYGTDRYVESMVFRLGDATYSAGGAA